jgi:2-polyprenyl-6-hydroxyphenyl methylase/3-demethylubiquinone-9 3-methyltransferase
VAFEAIVCIEVIEHLYSPYTFARRAYDALSPGGTIVISTPYWGYLKNVALALSNRIDRSLTALWEGGHIKHFSRATLGRLFTDCGFEQAGFVGAGEGWRAHAPYLWNGMLMAFRRPLQEGNMMSSDQGDAG